jgi:hypothetical protein
MAEASAANALGVVLIHGGFVDGPAGKTSTRSFVRRDTTSASFESDAFTGG